MKPYKPYDFQRTEKIKFIPTYDSQELPSNPNPQPSSSTVPLSSIQSPSQAYMYKPTPSPTPLIEKIPQSDSLNLLTKINELESRISSLEKSVQFFEQFIKLQSIYNNKNTSDSKKINEQSDLNQGLSTDIYNKINILENKIINYQNKFNQFDFEQNILDKISPLKMSINQNINEINNNFDELNRKYLQFEKELRKVDKNFGKIYEEIDGCNNRISECDNKIIDCDIKLSNLFEIIEEGEEGNNNMETRERDRNNIREEELFLKNIKNK